MSNAQRKKTYRNSCKRLIFGEGKTLFEKTSCVEWLMQIVITLMSSQLFAPLIYYATRTKIHL